MKYKFTLEMKLKDIKDWDVISNLLNDDFEWLFRMYLASTYQKYKLNKKKNYLKIKVKDL